MFSTIELVDNKRVITLEVKGYMDDWQVLAAYINDDDQTNLSDLEIDALCDKHCSYITEQICVNAQDEADVEHERFEERHTDRAIDDYFDGVSDHE